MNVTNISEIKFQLYNVLSCKGFETSESIGMTFGPCAQAKIILVVLFFISALVRKWVGESMGFEYSFLWGTLGSLISCFVVLTLTGNIMIGFIVGMVGMIIFGFLGGQIFGGGDEYE